MRPGPGPINRRVADGRAAADVPAAAVVADVPAAAGRVVADMAAAEEEEEEAAVNTDCRSKPPGRLCRPF